MLAQPAQDRRPPLNAVTVLGLFIRHLAFFDLVDNSQFKGKGIITLGAFCSGTHNTFLDQGGKVSTLFRTGQPDKKRAANAALSDQPDLSPLLIAGVSSASSTGCTGSGGAVPAPVER